MSLMSEGSPQIFVKRDWLQIQDQQSGNYAGNQLVLDTSQLANSNKYTDYRNAYLSIPMVMAMSSTVDASGTCLFSESGTELAGIDSVPSLKNWFGSIVNSMLLDYAGTTIIQNTPLCGLWNTFTLMTSLSMADVETLGPTIGFYPDGPNFRAQTGGSGSGEGTCNNVKTLFPAAFGPAGQERVGNAGIYHRWSDMMITAAALSGSAGDPFNTIVTASNMDQVYRSRVTTRSGIVAGQVAFVAFQIQAFIYLRHLHSFFSQIPLLKGVFFRLTLNLNQPIVTLSTDGTALTITEIISPLGGVSPIMIASQSALTTQIEDSTGVLCDVESNWGLNVTLAGAAPATTSSSMRVTLNVGNKLIDSTQISRIPGLVTGLNQSCFLNVPMFTFNPAFESAYLSRPTKTIVYSDLYQYTTPAVSAGAQFNFLITNGISNIKSVIVLPMEEKIQGPSASYPPFWSPFDTCGGGSCAPLSGSSLTNFNVVVAGQNMVYNQVTRAYEQFNNQLYGANAVNAGLVDGMTSGLVSYWDFLQLYGYFYVNCARQLPIDEAVPKSVSIQGTNLCESSRQYYVFIEYGVQVNVDVLTGARV